MDLPDCPWSYAAITSISLEEEGFSGLDMWFPQMDLRSRFEESESSLPHW